MSLMRNPNLLADDTPGAENDERKRLHAARLNSVHLRQSRSKRMLQLAFEEIERLLELSGCLSKDLNDAQTENDSLEMLLWTKASEIERLKNTFFRRLARRVRQLFNREVK